MILVAEGNINPIKSEDGGQAMLGEPISFHTGNSDEDNGLFIRLCSWDDNLKHVDLNKLQRAGGKIRITIETID